MEYFNPVNIISFPGSRNQIASTCKSKKVLIICSMSAYTRLCKDKKIADLFLLPDVVLEHGFTSNPAMDDIEKISNKYALKDLEVIIGLGGGSAMDVAKIASVAIPAAKEGISLDQLLVDTFLLNNLDVLECIQIPTTAGTGSEVTPFATVWDYKNQQKKSLSHPKMFAKTCYIDSDFLIGLPIEISLSTGLDALNQAFESIWNKNSTDISKLFALKAAEKSLNALPKLSRILDDEDLRQDLMIASVFAGIAISQTRTAICHSISYPLTLNFSLPHGYACAFSMIEVFDFNYDLIVEEISNMKGFEDAEQIRKRILDILETYGFATIIKSYISSENSIINLMDEMHTTGRFENNIRECNKEHLQKIIRKSCKRIYRS